MNREEITNNAGYAQEKANLEYIRQRQEHGVNDPYMITEIDEAFDAGYDKGYQYAQTHPNWISVEDELPPKMDKWTKASDYVLVYTNESEWLIGRYWHDGDGWSVSGFTKAKVTHWMPIVPPRKEE